MDALEATRRQSATQRVIAFFAARPGIWIDAIVIMEALPSARLAWRTRISDARKHFKKDGGDIENRQLRAGNVMERDAAGQPVRLWLGSVRSEYRYVPQKAVGPSADQYRDQTFWNLPEGR